MEYSFSYRVRPGNLLALSLINTYRSTAGLVNIVFTISMAALIFRFWTVTGPVSRILMAAGFLLFPVVQPVLIYLRSRTIVGNMPPNMTISFDDTGFTVLADKEKSHIHYHEVQSIMKKFHMLIIYTQSKGSYVLDSRTLADRDRELYHFLKNKVQGE